MALCAGDPEHRRGARGTDVAFNHIGKRLGPEHRFVANWRWRMEGTWRARVAVSDPRVDAWHTNVMSRPDGSVLAGWDEGAGQSATTVDVAEGRHGRFSPPKTCRPIPTRASGSTSPFRPTAATGSPGFTRCAAFHSSNTFGRGLPRELPRGVGAGHARKDRHLLHQAHPRRSRRRRPPQVSR